MKTRNPDEIEKEHYKELEKEIDEYYKQIEIEYYRELEEQEKGCEKLDS